MLRRPPVHLLLLACSLLVADVAWAQGRLGPRAAELVRAVQRGGDAEAVAMARAMGLRVQSPDGVDLVPVLLEPRAGLRARDLADRGLEGFNAASRSFARVLVRPSRIDALTRHPDVDRVTLPLPHEALGFGSIVSEAAALVGADQLHALGFDGSGIRVAVVDLGFQGLAGAIAAGELPASTIVGLLPGQGSDPTWVDAFEKHGVAVAEQVMDMAPGVELHVIVVSDQLDLENAVDYLAANQIDIANHSVGWVLSSYYDDTGVISAAVNDSHDNDGVFWSVAAGNGARQHWRGTWTDSDGDRRLEWETGNEELALKDTNKDICLFLNWDDYPNTSRDLNLYLVDANGSTVASSTAVQNGNDSPTEGMCPIDYAVGTPPYHVEVERRNGSSIPTTLDITLFTFDHDVTPWVTASSMMDPAPAHGAFTVGAVSAVNYPETKPPIRAWSARGPTNDGRTKPDIVGPDGTQSWTYPNATGTSFSAPAVAGAAALLWQIDGTMSVAQLESTLATLALDVVPTGQDYSFGWGKLDVTGSPVLSGPECGDGVDNDGDTFVDAGDPGCGGKTTGASESPQCNDGIDNDNDGDIDLADAQCGSASGKREAKACGIGFELAILLPPLLAWRRRRRA